MPMKTIIDNNVNYLNLSKHCKKIEKLHKNLSGKLTKPERIILLQILDEYGLLLEHCAEENYKTGLRNGFAITSFLHKTPIKLPNT